MPINGLKSPRPVNMGHGWDLCSLVFANLKYLHHEWDGVVLLEPFVDRLLEHGWCERAERLAPLYLSVKNGFHVGAPRITNYRAVPERSRSPFHAPLEPADDLAICDRCGNAPGKLRVIISL